jgi:tetratricopeptide (TPR) repeat protein
MHGDRYGLPLSTTSAQARDAYVEAADCVLSAVAGPEACFERAIQADANFALAHAGLARAQFLAAQTPRARAAAVRARELAAHATPREQSHVNALALPIEGKMPEALAATREHLAQYPRDAMVLAPATGVFGLIGFSGRQQREAELLELLRSLAPHYGTDWWFLCVLAFAACECGHLDEAMGLIEQSLDGNPRNAHGAHIHVHVLYEKGETETASRYLDGWMPAFDKAGLLHCHLSWHMALAALELGQIDRAWAVYRAQVHPGGAWGPPINVATDAAAFLWRSELASQPRQPQLWREVHEFAQQSFPKARLAFADVHRAVACAATGDTGGLDQLVSELRALLADDKLPAGPVVATLAEAFGKFAAGDWDAAIALFERALPETVRIGGSRAQRDLVEQTLVAAYLKAGRANDAQQLIARRMARRPAVNVAGFNAA